MGTPSPLSNQSEADLHKQVADFLSIALPSDAFWTTIGHGVYMGANRFRVGARQKRAGQRAGVPDIYIGYGAGNFWIELKAKRGWVKPEQATCHAEIRKAGGYAAVCRSLDEVIGTLRGWNIPLQVAA